MNSRRLKAYSAPPCALLHRRNGPELTTLALAGIRQAKNYTCGFAVALMTARYCGYDLSGRELYEMLGTDRHGTSQSALIGTLRGLGIKVNVRYDIDFQKIKRRIDQSKVVIAYLNDDEHWLVIYGYGLNPQRVFVADPRPGQRCEEDWELYGKRLGRFGMSCSAPALLKTKRPRLPKADVQLAFDIIV